jgi:hypothetical protein
VERADAIEGNGWTKAAEVVLGPAGSAEVDLGASTGDAAWFRARWP